MSNPIYGVLYLNNKIIYGYNKNNIPYKKFISKNKEEFLVATKKDFQLNNVYAIIFDTTEIKNNKKIGRLDDIIGEIGNYDSELLYIIRVNNFKTIKNTKVNENDIIKDRIDLTDKYIISIDPENCYDIDDAIHIEEYNDYYEIGIHIADVSSYIDNIELNRVQTIYLPNYQIDMLPNNLVEKCSLIKNIIKRSFSIIYKFSKEYKLINYELKRCYIKVRENYTYENAERLIKKNKNEILVKLYNFGEKLYKSEKYDTHKMIENYMILANSTIGSYLYNNNIPNSILRIHHIENISNNLFEIRNKLTNERAKYIKLSETINDNIKHDSLNIKYYTHFTSPIRRIVDIIIHKLLTDINSINITNDYIDYLNNKIIDIKKAEYNTNLLNLIYNIYNNDTIKEYYGNIILINDNKIDVYISELNLIMSVKLFSNKIRHLLKYSYTTEQLILNNIILNIYEQIKLRIVITLKEPYIKNKILIQIIEPIIKLE